LHIILAPIGCSIQESLAMIDSMNQLDVVYVLEIISVVSFAISGALVGVRKKMDYL